MIVVDLIIDMFVFLPRDLMIAFIFCKKAWFNDLRLSMSVISIDVSPPQIPFALSAMARNSVDTESSFIFAFYV